MGQRARYNSKNKIITSIIISVKHEDNKNKPDVVHHSKPWVVPVVEFDYKAVTSSLSGRIDCPAKCLCIPV